MGIIISMLGFLGFLICAVMLIVSFIKKKPKKKIAIGMVAALVLFIGGGIASTNAPVKTASPSVSQVESSASIQSQSASSEKTIEQIRADAKAIDYKELARYPEKYKDQVIKTSGTVVQTLESKGTYTLRVAENGDYDKMFLVTYIQSTDARILEKDKITIYGLYNGVKSYESKLGDTITLPFISTADITINE